MSAAGVEPGDGNPVTKLNAGYAWGNLNDPADSLVAGDPTRNLAEVTSRNVEVGVAKTTVLHFNQSFTGLEVT